MKYAAVLLLPILLAACEQTPDRETSLLVKYYAERGDEMTTTLERAKAPAKLPQKSTKLNPTPTPKPTL